MHPVLFEIPGLGWPVRMFGLFIIDAFFLGTLWVQFMAARRADPGFAADGKLGRIFAIVLAAVVATRVLLIALPIGWSATVIAVLVIDLVLAAWAWANTTVAFREHEKARQEGEFVFNLGFWLLLIGFVGARIFWIFTTEDGPGRLMDEPLNALFAVWDGGIVWYGGLICSSLFAVWYLWWKDRNVLALGDLILPGVALALFIGRWSCLAAGDDYGAPSDVPWAIVFPVDAASQIPKAYQGTTPLHPSQLYMSLNGLLVFLACLFLLKRKRFDGQVVYSFFILYAIGRSIVEIYRGDAGRGIHEFLGMELSSSQIISIPVFLVAVLLLVRGFWKSRRRPASPAAA